MSRESFYIKYSNLAARWNIDFDLVFSLIAQHEARLHREIEELGRKGFDLDAHFQDKRTVQEYVYDLVDGWLMEDIMLQAWFPPRLRAISEYVTIQANGTDKDRIIQKDNSFNNITTEPDFNLIWGGQKINSIELQMARRALFQGYDMKQPKVQRAMQLGSLFFWIIIPSDEFFILRPQTDMVHKQPQPNPAWGGKMVYHIDYAFIHNLGGTSKMSGGFNHLHRAKLNI